ncbi:uncharacterized protein LOC120151191 [Hibiscus syriacus]|uniref:uncharacterized protein LOC120151191 n=1 Tax=Hibiscus syriacus TaxID=106335 RepID=UPI00192061B4|nr:uncharacterized protein LOC120151191 [Hibiscus syriacus]
MAIPDRLPTVNRLARMGIGVEDKCRSCGTKAETRSHIFFGCSFSKAVWEVITRLCNVDRMVGCWDEELNWAISRFKGKTLFVSIFRIAWCASVYCIWEERNHRQFKGISRDVDSVVSGIKEIVRLKSTRFVIKK